MKTYNKFSQSGYQLLLTCLKKPETVTNFDMRQWTLLMRMSKICNLTAHLAWLLEQQNLLPQALPEKVQEHFTAARTLINYRHRLALWEINRLQQALSPHQLEFIVLKGSAYLLAELPFATSRLFADVDILVDKAELSQVEQVLLNQNWQSQNTDDYDQQYYRQWMHEIPPLKHVIRAIEVDIHHTIIPPVSRLRPDPAQLIGDAIKIPGAKCKILAPTDMVLHSSVHLFYDSDLQNRLKDLVDLDQLIRHYCALNPVFLNELLDRAETLGLLRPLYYALRYIQQILATPIPPTINELIESKARPPFMIKQLMDILVPLALLPEHPDYPTKKVAFARWLLYIRSHYLRMPLKLLIPHLAHKSLLRWQVFVDSFKNAQ